MELIIFAVIIYYIVKAVKQSSEGQANEAKMKNQYQQMARENMEKVRQRTQMSPREIYEQMHMSDYASKQVQQPNRQEVQAQIEKTKQRIKGNQAMQQVKASRTEARNTTILQRAKANAEEDKADVTLQTMEAEHNHSERVSVAKHHHPEDVILENMLGSIEDLMVKGYDGNLCFERDFLGEAMDMIGRFTVPSDVPDFSGDNVA